MSDYFDAAGNRISDGLTARAADVNALRDEVGAGFDLLPTEDDLKKGTTNYAVDSGAANAYVVTLDYAPAAYTDGMLLVFKATNANTGASTVNVNALGVKALKRNDGNALLAGDVPANKIASFRYNGTSGNFEMVYTANALGAATATSLAIGGALRGGTGFTCSNTGSFDVPSGGTGWQVYNTSLSRTQAFCAATANGGSLALQNSAGTGYFLYAGGPSSTDKLTITGDLSVSGTFSNPSDARDKTNVRKLAAGLSLLMKCKPVAYEWRPRGNDAVGPKDIGFLAQDLQEIDDDWLRLVVTKNQEKLEVAYGRLIPVLVNAIQELKQEVDNLRAQVLG